MTLTDKTCIDTEYFTPPHVLGAVLKYFGGNIVLDPATHPSNPTKAAYTYTEGYSGLDKSWHWALNIFVNPPFGRQIRDWVAKIHEEASKGAHIIALLPGQRFEQQYWQDHVFCNELTAICFIRKRLSFLGLDGKPRKGNPYGSMLYLYNGDKLKFAKVMTKLGIVIEARIYR